MGVVARENRAFESVAAIRADRQTLTGRGSPMQIRVARVTASFYTTLRTAPALGRTVVLMDEYWRHELGRGGAGELPAGDTRGEGGPGGVAAGGVGGLGRDAPTGPPTSRSRNGVAATSRDV